MWDNSKKAIPIGIENFKRIIEDDYYYVDKSLFIKELLDSKALVNLITRPRRFGKTLNISMLRYFFEKSTEDNAHLFNGLKIMDAGEKYTSQMGQYPVISLTLKGIEGRNFDEAFYAIKNMLSFEFDRHLILLSSDKLSAQDKILYETLCDRKGNISECKSALKFLCDCLHRHYEKKVIILIDEYDVPLDKSYQLGYYDEMVSFIRGLLQDALKTNDALEFAVLTGCLRISKESIFTGLNNLEVFSIRNPIFASSFGFLQEEIDAALNYYSLADRHNEIKAWYDGYIFGEDTAIYNPWSSIKVIKSLIANHKALMEPYWSTTSGNAIIRKLIDLSDNSVKSEIEELIAGGSITKPIHEDITYDEVYKTQDNIWNFLFFTGYLKKVSEESIDDQIFVTMKIPNKETRNIYMNKIQGWFTDYLQASNTSLIFKAMLDGNAEELEIEINRILMDTISYYDYGKEGFYHAFMTGILAGQHEFAVQSERESGTGRPDLMIFSRINTKQPAVTIEIKFAKTLEELPDKMQEGLAQQEEKDYTRQLDLLGYKHIVKYVIVFYKKMCRVK